MSVYYRSQSGTITALNQSTSIVEVSDSGFVIYLKPSVSDGTDAATFEIQISETNVSGDFVPAPGDSVLVVSDAGVSATGYIPVVGQKIRLKCTQYTRQVAWKIVY